MNIGDVLKRRRNESENDFRWDVKVTRLENAELVHLDYERVQWQVLVSKLMSFRVL